MASPDTIFALASAGGRAAVAIVRVSGPRARAALEALAGTCPAPRTAQLARLRAPGGGRELDSALVLWFPGPKSFTGEDVAEFQVHGGRAVVAGVLEALAGLEGLRPAEPGEFTRRAFENDRMDLAEAEGLADLIDAETEAQRTQALRQMEGGLSGLAADWRETLVKALSLVAADIDFPDEDDVPGGLTAEAKPLVEGLIAALEDQLREGEKASRLRAGLEIAIIGAPNVGKSSLLNALARRDAAIVSATAGTTRDVVEVQMDIGGYPVTLADTAGLREAADEIEREGITRALARAENADLRLVVFDASTPGSDAASLGKLREGDIAVANKRDLAKRPLDLPGAIATSTATGEGLAELERRLGVVVRERASVSESPVITRARHKRAVEDALSALKQALHQPEPELCGEDLRLAARAIERLVGRVDVEDLLDRIFSEFCIGK